MFDLELNFEEGADDCSCRGDRRHFDHFREDFVLMQMLIVLNLN